MSIYNKKQNKYNFRNGAFKSFQILIQKHGLNLNLWVQNLVSHITEQTYVNWWEQGVEENIWTKDGGSKERWRNIHNAER
jgi:hypothetical protein